MYKLYFYGLLNTREEEAGSIISKLLEYKYDVIWDGGSFRRTLYDKLNMMYGGLSEVGYIDYTPYSRRILYEAIDDIYLMNNLIIDEADSLRRHARDIVIPVLGGYIFTSTVLRSYYRSRWMDFIGVTTFEYINSFSEMFRKSLYILREAISAAIEHDSLNILLIDLIPGARLSQHILLYKEYLNDYTDNIIFRFESLDLMRLYRYVYKLDLKRIAIPLSWFMNIEPRKEGYIDELKLFKELGDAEYIIELLNQYYDSAEVDRLSESVKEVKSIFEGFKLGFSTSIFMDEIDLDDALKRLNLYSMLVREA